MTAPLPSEPPDLARPGARRRNPWWIPPFLGRVPPLEDHHLRALGIVTLGLFFEAYDMSLLTSALKHIAEDLQIAQERLGFHLGAVRLGGLIAFLLLPLADRMGRRRVFLLSMLGMSVCTLATALAQNPVQFVASQIAARAFLATLAAVGVVMLAEELPAAHRGWGVGILGALSACGHGAGALLFAAIDVLPGGWRALYGIGAIPLLLLPTFRRRITETGRFRRHQEREAAGAPSFAPLRSLLALARANPGRAGVLGAAALIQALGAISLFQFAALFVQQVHGWEPWRYSAMLMTSGALGIVGNVVAGRLGDRVGRRRIGVASFVVLPVAGIAFYTGPGWVLPLAFIVVVFANSAADVIIRVFSTELFPTAQRGAAAAWLALLQTIGWIVGLWIVGVGTTAGHTIHAMVSYVAVILIAPVVLLARLPETKQRELEETSGEL